MGLFIILVILLSVAITFYSGSTAIGASLMFFISVGIIMSFLLGSNFHEKRKLTSLFCITFLGYISYAFLMWLDFLNFGFFQFPDQDHFYDAGNSLGKLNSIGHIFDQCFIERVHVEQEGAYFIFGTIAFIANKFFDGNSVLLQSLHISFLAILVNLFLFKILRSYVDLKTSFRYTMIFAFLSPLFYYSPWILRDIHIVLLYTISFYIFNKDFSFRRFLIYIPLVLITLEFRFEHGVFLTIFPFLYFYLKGKAQYSSQVRSLIFSFFGVLFVAFLGFYFWSSANAVLSTLGRYSTSTQDSISDGFSAYLYNLPVGLKQIAIIIHSQFTPLPPWVGFLTGLTEYQKLSGLILIICTSFWSCLFLYLFYSAFIVKNVKSKISQPLLFLFGAVIVFLLANSANMTVRRVLAIYPILFVIFVSIKNEIVNRKSQRLMHYSLLTYTGLLTLYLIARYF